MCLLSAHKSNVSSSFWCMQSPKDQDLQYLTAVSFITATIMATTICFIIWVVFVTDSVWTRTVRQVYEVHDPEDFNEQDFDCPRECFCPPSFPTALYCENRGLREIPAIPSRIWYLYLENNLIETIPEKPFENATQLRWINLNKNKITNDGIEKGALSQLKKLLFLFLEGKPLGS